MAVRGLGCPVRFTLTAGQKGDAPQAAALIEGFPAEVVMADTAYDADHLRKAIAAKGALAVIPNNPSRALKYPLDKHLYAQRHLVECCFSKLKQFRRVATRFEKTARNIRPWSPLPPSSYGCDKCPQDLEFIRAIKAAERRPLSCVPSMIDSLEVEVLYPA
jgi:transposase